MIGALDGGLAVGVDLPAGGQRHEAVGADVAQGEGFARFSVRASITGWPRIMRRNCLPGSSDFDAQAKYQQSVSQPSAVTPADLVRVPSGIRVQSLDRAGLSNVCWRLVHSFENGTRHGAREPGKTKKPEAAKSRPGGARGEGLRASACAGR